MLWILWPQVASAGGLAAGLIAGAGIPLSDPTASPPVAPDFGLIAGWQTEAGPLHLQPELLLKFRLAEPALIAPLGLLATAGSDLRLGAYTHVSVPILMSYPFPGVDAGLAIGLSPGDHWDLALRAGYEWVHPIHYKCGPCPQPSDHWLDALLSATYSFAR